MDRSFLSQPEVIAASRHFINIRLTTYEDEKEAAFLRSLFIGRSGDVENTTFVLLAPDGMTRLTKPGRGTRGLFTDAIAMAHAMDDVAKRYPGNADAQEHNLPITLDARLGLDVAASDNLPLVLVLAGEPGARTALEKRVATLAWRAEFLGRFTYAIAHSPQDLKSVPGLEGKDGMVIVEPDPFGQEGKVVAYVPATDADAQLGAAMQRVTAARPHITKDERRHRAEAIGKGAFWETKLPVTDRQELQARERTKQAMGK